MVGSRGKSKKNIAYSYICDFHQVYIGKWFSICIFIICFHIAYLSVIHKQAMGSSHVGSESTNRMDVNGHNGEDLDGTNIDDIHGSNQHCANNNLSDDAAWLEWKQCIVWLCSFIFWK